MKRRIMLYGGAGSGKSTSAFYLLWRLKSNNIPAEHAREWVKRKAFTDPKPPDALLDRSIIMAEQLREEREAIATGAVVVSDSPVLMQAVYAHRLLDDAIFRIAQRLEIEHGAARHIFLKRNDEHYDTRGRWGTLEQAKVKDDMIRQLLKHAGIPFVEVEYGDWEGLWTAATS